MNGGVKLAPSILSADFSRLGAEVRAVEAAGADWIHIDVMDGRFVPNITIGPLVTEAVRRCTDLPLDVHLMIEAPERYVRDFAQAGANIVSVHLEATTHLHRTLLAVREAGARAGLALNPATPISWAREVLGLVDLLVIMSVNPGFGGQAYIPGSSARVAEARRVLNAAGRDHVPVEVDGGVSPRTKDRLVQAGAGVLVAGSAIFGHPGGAGAGVASLIDQREEAKGA